MNTYRCSRNYQDHLREVNTYSRTKKTWAVKGTGNYMYGDGIPKKYEVSHLCGHQECYTCVDGLDYMLKGCLKAKLYVPRTRNKIMDKKYSKINVYVTKN